MERINRFGVRLGRYIRWYALTTVWSRTLTGFYRRPRHSALSGTLYGAISLNSPLIQIFLTLLKRRSTLRVFSVLLCASIQGFQLLINRVHLQLMSDPRILLLFLPCRFGDLGVLLPSVIDDTSLALLGRRLKTFPSLQMTAVTSFEHLFETL